jgi:hypothetical protein
VQPAEPKRRFTMVQRCVQMGVFKVLPPSLRAVGNFINRFVSCEVCGLGALANPQYKMTKAEL